MTLKSDEKFEEKPNCCFKNDKNLAHLIQALKSVKNLHFDWSLSCKVYHVWPKKVQRSISFMTQKSHAKFEEKLTCDLENDMT